MRFWFGRKSAAADVRPCVPAWLGNEGRGGFARDYDHSSSGMSGLPSALDQRIGVGDGETSRFELVKTYGPGEMRRITRPRPGTVRVAVATDEMLSGWSMTSHGAILFDEPPSAGSEITAGFMFDVPVRFESDRIEINRATFLAGEAPSVPLIEIREA